MRPEPVPARDPKSDLSVLQDEQEAARIGVNAVPAFVADRKAALSGVQSRESLEELVEHVLNGERGKWVKGKIIGDR